MQLQRQSANERRRSSYAILSTLKLTFLVHVMFGVGLPDALHSNVTESPLRTSIELPDFSRCMRGGTETSRNVN